MKFRKCAAAGVLALCLAAAGPLSALAGQNAGPGAAYQPSVNGVNIYVSKMGNTLTLKQYAQTIGTWPVKLGRRSETGTRCRRETKSRPPDRSMCAQEMTRAYAIWLWDYPIPMPRMQSGV